MSKSESMNKEPSYSDLEVEHKMGTEIPQEGASETEAKRKEPKFPVLEIFGPTLQGEGSMIGVQTMFIRFGGCDYRCVKCDSLHAVLPELIKQHAKRMTTLEIIQELEGKARYCKVVTFSGGNPLMWDLEDLACELKRRGWRIAVETQGTVQQDWLRFCTWVTVSPKGPGMGEVYEPDKFHSFIQHSYHLARMYGHIRDISVKVVLFDQLDIEFAKAIAVTVGPGFPFYLSVGNPYPPVPGKDDTRHPQDLTGVLLNRMRVLYEDIQNEPLLANARFLPQMHVLLWANELGR